MKVLSALISIYILIIFIRIMLTWFHGPALGRPMQILIAITEPYLAWFRRIPVLRTDRIDFSPIIALIVLVILQNITSTIARLGTISLGIVLGLIISALWSAISFLLVFFIILIVVRIIGWLLNANSVSPIWQTLDLLLHPVVYRVSTLFSGGRPLTYPVSLAITGGTFLVASLVLRFLVQLLVTFLMNLPF
jgi:YggT family protein